jgi:3-deoxy-7-phosphoheptulonate synthase/chorismate mutase
MSESIKALDELRGQIDEIDLKLLALLNSRADVVLRIQDLKLELGLPPYSAIREGEIIHQLRTANMGPLPDQAVEDIFREILQHSLSSLVLTDD